MAKSKAKKAAKRNKQRDNRPSTTVDSVEAKDTKDEKEIIEEVESREDEEVVEDDEEETKTVEDEDEDEEEVEDDEESEDDDDESEDDDDEDDDEDEDESDEEDEDESEDESEDDDDKEESEDDDDEDDEDESDEEDEDESEDESEDDDDEEESEDDDDEDDEDNDEDEKKSSKSSKNKVIVISAKKSDKKKKINTKKSAIVSKKKDSVLSRIFSRKCDPEENILTIFRDTKIIGAIIGEIFGTAIVAAIALTLGLFNPLYIILAYIGITLAIFKLSGAHLNPTITAGMMTSRRVSAIRGFIYIIAQIIGAWVGTLIVRGFFRAGVNSGNIDVTYNALPALKPASELSAATEGYSFFWAITLIEFIGAIILGFFFARAQAHKKNAASYAIIIATGMFLALLFAVVINSNFFMINDNTFIFNPAVGLVYGVFPTSADGFGALMSALMPMLASYIIFPVLGGIIGFFISDAATAFSGEDFKSELE